MAELFRAQCPRCRQQLTIPAVELGKTVRCQHCGQAIYVRPRRAPEPPTAPPSAATPSPVAPSSAPATPRRWRTRVLLIAAGLLLAVGIASLALYRSGHTPQPAATPVPSAETSAIVPALPPPILQPKKTPQPPAPPLAPEEVPASRRLLVISVNNYWYANPVSYGSVGRTIQRSAGQATTTPMRSVHALVQRLVEALHVPAGQWLELSDSAPAARAPLKEVIEATITHFLQTCRSQDRTAVMFIGHALDLNGEAYLVPVEGDLGNARTLIPLSWLYGLLERCAARQKVLIMDVCRFDPLHGQLRPSPGPMGPKLDALLSKPPSGVQVWSACVAGQFSYEGLIPLASGEVVHAGLFANAFYESLRPLATSSAGDRLPRPEEPLPLEVLAQGTGNSLSVAEQTKDHARQIDGQLQTPRWSGHEPPAPQTADADEPTPSALTIARPQNHGAIARPGLIAQIWQEITIPFPFPLGREGIQPIRPAVLPPFAAKTMRAFQETGTATPLRDAVHKAVQRLRQSRFPRAFEERFVPRGNDVQMKAGVLATQQQLALVEAELEDTLEELRQAGQHRERECKRWQANYDYVLGALLMRIVLMDEYNYMLGQIRKDELPARNPALHSGWCLAWKEAPPRSTPDARKKLTEARRLFTELAQRCPDTPWALLAQRDAVTAVSMEWKPCR